ncbi:MAG: deoxynucleoside kinase [Bacteroidota bacterium]|nr:deoxynucleoside kinase [Bacteroidota bacterium]
MTNYDYICIEGNIGAGKTTLSHMLSEEFNAKLILEQFEDNSFLPKFYEDPEKYAFPLELSFLAERFQQLKKELSSHDLFYPMTIADYFISKSLIFARSNLQNDEYALFQKLFQIILPNLPKPNLIVYLHAGVSRLQDNIKLRGRSYEQNIMSSYLIKIQDAYLEYLRMQQELKILIIDTEKIDFVHNKDHYIQLKEIIFSEHPVGISRYTVE